MSACAGDRGLLLHGGLWSVDPTVLGQWSRSRQCVEEGFGDHEKTKLLGVDRRSAADLFWLLFAIELDAM